MKKLVAIILTFLFIIVGCNKVEVTKINDDIKTDSIKFHNEYKKVDRENIYEYETYDNIIDILENKTGIIYLGFPSCDLCKEITPILNDISKEKNINKISYYNFKNIRENNTLEYKKLVNILSDYILEDDEGNKRISAPTIIFVRKGEIVGLYKGVITGNQEEIITEEQKIELKQYFNSLIEKMLIEQTTEEL